MKILVLWSSLADYTNACFKQLSSQHNVSLYMVHQKPKSQAPYHTFDTSFCKEVREDTQINKTEIVKWCIALDPDFIIMASWNYKHYMSIARAVRKKGTYVLSAFDGQWAPTFRQIIASIISPFYFVKYIDNFVVPGDRQAKYARKLGYKTPLNGFYCANNEHFLREDAKIVKKRFVFVGRLVDIKGITELLTAYKTYRSLVTNPWELVIAGTGEYLESCQNQEGITALGFIQPNELPQLFKESICLILPSHYEPWGVVVHEAALAGLLILCSYQVGASTWFVRDGGNGYIIEPSISSLVDNMLKISILDDSRIKLMSDTSYKLGMLWTTDKWAKYIHENFISHIRTR